jgi:hypothetical protein
MEAKYYTPELDELHIGFECEVLYENNFKKCKIAIGIIDNNICARFNEPNKLIDITFSEESIKKLRVKFLDHYDIQSLGWQQISYDSFKINTKDHTIQLDLDHDYKTYIFETNYRHENFFKGIIKNKSELKKIMVQTGILKQ